MATQNKDQFYTKPQDDIQGNTNKYSKLCEIMTQSVATQANIDKDKFFKNSLLLIEKNPYAIRLIYELIKSYIEARANNFNDSSMRNLIDSVWRLFNERKWDYKENGRSESTTGHFIRCYDNFVPKIIGVSFPAYLRNVIRCISSDVTNVVEQIQAIKQQLEEQKSDLDYNKTQQIIEAYNNYVSNKTHDSLKDIITFFIEDSDFDVDCCFEDYVGYQPPPLIAKIYEDIENDKNNDIKNDINKYTAKLSQEIKSDKNYTIPYEDYKKQEDKETIKKLREIFAISEENEKEDLDNLNYNTYCCGFRKYDTSTLYNKGINTINNDIPDRYTDYSPPTSCCGVLW